MQRPGGKPLSEAPFAGVDAPFMLDGLEVQLDNLHAAWAKKRITLFARRGDHADLHAHGITSSIRTGQAKDRDLRSERNVTAFLFRWVENGRTLFSEIMEADPGRVFEAAYIQWVAATDGHPDSVGLAGTYREPDA